LLVLEFKAKLKHNFQSIERNTTRSVLLYLLYGY